MSLDLIKADFRNFLYVVWKHLNLPEPTPLQYDIAAHLQNVYEGKGPRRAIIEAFRGVGKSWVTSAFVCWVLLKDPQTKILVVSASKTRSDDFSTFTKRLINELPILRHLRARTDQRNSNVAFDVAPARAAHAPSVKSIGISGQLAGSRANIIIADDVEVPSNSQTQTMREKLSESVKEFDAVLSPGGIIIYLGTPQTESSLYNILQERGYCINWWPARVPAKKAIENNPGDLAPYILKLIQDGLKEGDPTDPMRFDDEDLLEREASYGRSGFALQFMLDTSLSDANKYPLKLSDLIVANIDNDKAPVKIVWSTEPKLIINDLHNVGLTGDRLHRPMWSSDEWTEYTGSVMAIDPSGRGEDETGYAVVKMLHGQLFAPACSGLQGGYAQDVLDELVRIAEFYRVNRIIIEANFGDGMFTQIFKPVLNKRYRCTTEEVKHSIQKEKRIIDTLEPVMNQHRLIISPDVIKKDFESTPESKYQLFYQMTRLTKEKGALLKDDRLDALAIAVAYWVEQMSRDVDQAVDDHKARAKKEALENFINHVVGHKPNNNNQWATIRR